MAKNRSAAVITEDLHHTAVNPYMIGNSLLAICVLTYFFVRGNALLDQAVAKGKITPDQATRRKKYVQALSWPHDGTYQQFGSLDLLPSVSAVLAKYTRWRT